jgi:hypothetical protein
MDLRRGAGILPLSPEQLKDFVEDELAEVGEEKQKGPSSRLNCLEVRKRSDMVLSIEEFNGRPEVNMRSESAAVFSKIYNCRQSAHESPADAVS